MNAAMKIVVPQNDKNFLTRHDLTVSQEVLCSTVLCSELKHSRLNMCKFPVRGPPVDTQCSVLQ